ncbi:hypothetical protein ACFL6C_02995 [Myxococcota bacterium]
MPFAHRPFWLWAPVCLACCGDAHIMLPTDDPGEGLEPMQVPHVRLLSPPEWKAGDVVTVLGSDFVPPQRGFTVVRLDGEYVEDGGQSRKVDMTVRARYKNAGKVEFVFEPAFPPDGFGHAIGTFFGQARAYNTDEESTAGSEPLSAQVGVGPSLIVWKTRPSSVDCPQRRRVEATVDGEDLLIDLEAIGMVPATNYTPLTFRAVYTDLEGEPHEVIEQLGGGNSVRMDLDLGRLASGGLGDYLDMVLDLNDVELRDLPADILDADVFVSLSVEDGHGNILQRTTTVNVGIEHAVGYDGNVHISQIYSPAVVSSCIPGGDYGRSVTYSSSESETRARSLALSANVGVHISVVNIGFGLNVGANISSASSQSLAMSGDILPGQFGVFYRQTQRIERLGQIMERSVCGDERVVGEAHVTDWNWAPDLAVTHDGVCPPAPVSNLPSAQVFP